MNREKKILKTIYFLSALFFVFSLILDLAVTIAIYKYNQQIFFEYEFNEGLKNLLMNKPNIFSFFVIFMNILPFFLIKPIYDLFFIKNKAEIGFIFFLYYLIINAIMHIIGVFSWFVFA